MGRVSEKILELEEDGTIVYSDDIKTWTLVEDLPKPQPFDLSEYLFQLQLNKRKTISVDSELRDLIRSKYCVTVMANDYIEMDLIQCVINTVRDFDKDVHK